MKVKPLCDRPTLVIVQDEEAVNFRASNLLAALFLRVFSIPEASHPCWNDASRAMTSSGLKSAMLRATVCINHYKGPYRSGRFGFELKEAALSFLRSVTDTELDVHSEDFAFDIGDPTAVLTKEKFLESPGVQTRLPAVSWIKIKLFLFVPSLWWVTIELF